MGIRQDEAATADPYRQAVRALREFCTPSEEVASLLRAAVDQFGLSARA